MKQSQIQRIRRWIGSVVASMASVVLVAPAAMALPSGSGGSGPQGTIETTVQGATGGTSDLVLVALGAAITLALMVAISFSVKGIQHRRSAHA